MFIFSICKRNISVIEITDYKFKNKSCLRIVGRVGHPLFVQTGSLGDTALYSVLTRLPCYQCVHIPVKRHKRGYKRTSHIYQYKIIRLETERILMYIIHIGTSMFTLFQLSLYIKSDRFFFLHIVTYFMNHYFYMNIYNNVKSLWNRKQIVARHFYCKPAVTAFSLRDRRHVPQIYVTFPGDFFFLIYYYMYFDKLSWKKQSTLSGNFARY